jgi:sec-independent protein translocase protein TatA
MFGSIGGAEILLIAVLALLLFGPRKLPQIGRSFGRALAEFRGATHEFKRGLEREVELETVREASDSVAEVRRDIADTVQQVTRPSAARGAIDPGGGGDTATRPARPADPEREPADPEREPADPEREPADPPHGDKPPQS